MTVLNMGQGGEVRLPEAVRKRYGLNAQTPLRLVETPGGIFLVPQSGAPPSEQLLRELEVWQALGAEAWDMFPYQEGNGESW